MFVRKNKKASQSKINADIAPETRIQSQNHQADDENGRPETAENCNYDLSDPSAFELLQDDKTPSLFGHEKFDELTRSQQFQSVQKALLTVEIARQKGVEVHGERICLPGRAPLSMFTLMELLFATLGFATGFIHFTATAKNFLLALFVSYILLVMEILIYHSCYRAMRTVMTILQTIGMFLLMALVGWAFYDLIANPLPGVKHHFLLGCTLLSFGMIPLIMFTHLVYFGRGFRYVEIKKKPKASEKPTKILKTPSNTPTTLI